MEQTPWLDRKFNFDFEPGLFPVIIGRLAGTFPRLHTIVEKNPVSMLTYQPHEKWSVQQHIGHLIDLEELHIGRIADFVSGAATLRAWDGINEKTEKGHHNTKTIQSLLLEFNRVRNVFLFDLTSLSDKKLVATAIHPRLNVPMRVIDMAYFVAEHDDHHIAKIREILKQ